MKFVKMHGLGNDFIIVSSDDFDKIENKAEFTVKMCSRTRGVGADGILVCGKTSQGFIRMTLWNSDGSTGEMCGNGIRCLALYAWEKGLVTEKKFEIMTDAGLKQIELNPDAKEVEVNMGLPSFKTSEIPAQIHDEFFIEKEFSCGAKTWTATGVSVGNPHCVIFVEDYSNIDVAVHGREIELCPVFPEKTNVEFVKVNNEHQLEMRVWERGAGITEACGTGACASFAAACETGRAKEHAEVLLPGGILKISFSEDGTLLMKGPAEFVFTGDYPF